MNRSMHMIRKTLLSLVFVFLAASLALGADGAAAGTKAQPRMTAPDFTLQDLSGKAWRLSDHRGKVVLIDFTTTWCPWCVKDIPNLKRVSEKYRTQKFEFVAVYINESKQKVGSFVQKNGIPYRVLLDTDAKTAMQYQVRGVPTKVVVDRDGSILCWMCQDEEALLEKALKK
jgi:peroxiredoxin